MKERVRAILVTPNDTMLVIKRVRPSVAPYWVVPGGGVEPTDPDRESALEREIREEIAGEINIIGLLHQLESQEQRQYFYLAAIKQWSFDDRTGPEFFDAGRGEYRLEEIPLTPDGIRSVELKPTEVADFLCDWLESEESLSYRADRAPHA